MKFFKCTPIIPFLFPVSLNETKPPKHLKISRFHRQKTSPKQGRLGGVYTIQLVTPSVVPIAVKMAITV